MLLDQTMPILSCVDNSNAGHKIDWSHMHGFRKLFVALWCQLAPKMSFAG